MAIIFTDNFETGDHRKWSEVQTTEGGTIAVSTETPIRGQYSSKSTSVGTGTVNSFGRVNKVLPAGYSEIYHRLLLLVSSIGGAHWTNFTAAMNNRTWYAFYLLGINFDGTLRLLYRHAGAMHVVTSSETIPLNQPVCIEVKVVVSDGAGEIRVYKNDVEVADLTQTGLNNIDAGLVDWIYDGIVSSYTPCTLFIDDVVVADRYVGIEPPGYIEGTVTDINLIPLEGAEVLANGYSAVTDINGHYLIEAQPETYTVTASAIGYDPKSEVINVLSGQTTLVNFTLSPSPWILRDNFNDNSLDTILWRVVRFADVSERNARIEVDDTGLELGTGIRFRQRRDIRDIDIKVDRDPRRCDNVRLTIGYAPEAERDDTALSYLRDTYRFWARPAFNILAVFRATPTEMVEVARGPWDGSCARMAIRIERHPNYPAEERYIIRFIEGEREFYSEECTWLINNIGGMGLVELFSEMGFATWDNFDVKKASLPEPLKHSVSVKELADTNGMVTPCAGTYVHPANSELSFAAIPNTGYLFNGWTVNGVSYTETVIIVTLDRNVTVESKGFSRDPNFRLLNVQNNVGGVTDLPSGINAIPVGQSVTLTATPETVTPPGITPSFKQWLLDGLPAGTETIITVTMDDDHVLEPTWTHPVPYDTWFIRSALILQDTPPAPPLDGPNFDQILDDLVSRSTEKQEINYGETRCCWWWDKAKDPTGNNPVIKEAPPYQPTLDQLRGAIRKIKAHGLKVSIALVPAEGTEYPFRTKPVGFDPDLFIENYFKNCAIPIAQLCEEEGVDQIVVAWELENPEFPNQTDWCIGHNAKRSQMINEVKKIFKGTLAYNIQSWYTPAGFSLAKQMTFLRNVDIIVMSAWFQMNRLPIDPRDVAIGIWFDWFFIGPGEPEYTNFMAWFDEFSTVMGKKLYLNSGYQNATGEILAPWIIRDKNAPMDPFEQRIAWKGALQAMRLQRWCAGYDMERYNEDQITFPPPHNTTSWRYHPENQDAIFKELNETLSAQLPPPPQATLTIRCEPEEGGTTSPSPGAHEYFIDTVVSILASPRHGYSFDHWTLDGNDIGLINPVDVTIDADHILTAHFAREAPNPLPLIALGALIGYLISR